jgi:quinol monooxygenase YgiN
MTAPLIVISTFRVKEGKLEELRRYYDKVIEIVQSNEPQLIAFHGFLNEDGSEMTSIQIHPDTASMDFHMQVLRENWDASFSEYGQMLANISIEYYGVPPKSALDLDDIDVQSQQGLTLKPVHISGFTRSAAAERNRTAPEEPS